MRTESVWLRDSIKAFGIATLLFGLFSSPGFAQQNNAPTVNNQISNSLNENQLKEIWFQQFKNPNYYSNLSELDNTFIDFCLDSRSINDPGSGKVWGNLELISVLTGPAPVQWSNKIPYFYIFSVTYYNQKSNSFFLNWQRQDPREINHIGIMVWLSPDNIDNNLDNGFKNAIDVYFYDSNVTVIPGEFTYAKALSSVEFMAHYQELNKAQNAICH